MEATPLTLSLSRALAHWADKDADKPAVTYDGKSVSRREFDLHTNRLARAYQELGVKQNDLVTIGLPNCLEFLEACYAIWKLGATPQPISYALPKFERDQIIELGQPVLVIGVEETDGYTMPCLQRGYVPDPALSDEPLPEITARYWRAMTSGGSTGRPKLIYNAPGSEITINHEDPSAVIDASALVVGPLYHMANFGVGLQGLALGNHVVVMSKFDPLETLKNLAEHKISYVFLVPTMMQRIWRLPEEERTAHDLSNLTRMLHAAAPCADWLKEAWIDWLGPEKIWEAYGGTESHGFTVINGVEWLEHRGSVGTVPETFDLKIVDKDGKPVRVGEIGKIYMMPKTGRGTTYEYIGAEPDALADGFESLGDLGYMDADGYLYIADRQTDMILSGGANIYPAEIEGAIEAFDGVRSAAVIGLPHEDLGNVIHAIVDVPAGGVSDQALLDHLAERLARSKLPRSFEFVAEPLRNDAGKVRRTQLRDERIAATKA
jgi:bile acid-coenzyme A ligase